MASEVKVLVKAENQTKTGFQAALNDAKKFGQEATKAATPGGGVGGGEVRKALKGLGGDLAQASTPAEALQAVVTRVAGAFGKVTAVVGAFAVGKIIAGQFEKLSEGVANSTKNLQDFSSNFAAAANATTMDQAISGFDRLQQTINASKANLAALKSDFGAVIANAVSGGIAFKEMAAAIQSMGNAATAALSGSSALQLNQAEQNAAAMQSGGAGAVKDLALKQQREREMQALQARMDAATTPQQRLDIENAMAFTRQRFGAEDKMRAASAQQEAAAAADKTASLGMTPAELLEKEKQAMSELVAKQKEFASAAAMAPADPTGGLNEAAAKYYELQTQIEASKQRQFAIDQQIKAEEERKAEAVKKAQGNALNSAQEQAKKNQESAMTPEERMKYEMQGLQDLAGFAGPEVELQRQQAIGRIMALQQQMNSGDSAGFQGSKGASAFQRIGFASNEFFDTRKAKDPTAETAKAVAVLKQIHKALSSGEPLVLNPSAG